MPCSSVVAADHSAQQQQSYMSFASTVSCLVSKPPAPVHCPAQTVRKAPRCEPQPQLVGNLISSFGKFKDSTDIFRATADLAAMHSLVPALPHFEEAPPNTVHPHASTYARDYAHAACGRVLESSFRFTQIGDLIIWTAVGIDGSQASGLTFVSPSHTLCADLVIGLHTKPSPNEPPPFTDELIALFAMMCQCVAVPKNRAMLMERDPEIKPLTPRELQVIRASAQGATAKQVSELIGISERTVNLHVQQALQKLGVPNKAQAIIRATRIGLI